MIIFKSYYNFLRNKLNCMRKRNKVRKRDSIYLIFRNVFPLTFNETIISAKGKEIEGKWRERKNELK